VTVTSGTIVEAVQITATDTSATPTVSGSQTLTVSSTIGPASQMTVSLNPVSILADGTHTTVATATIKDSNGNPVDADAVSFSAFSTDTSSAGVTFGDLKRGATGTGTYLVQIKGTIPGTVMIRATDTSVSPSLIGTATLNLTPTGAVAPGAASVVVSVNPVAIFADGVSHAFATATVTASDGTPVVGDAVQFLVNNQNFGSVCITDSNGQCHVTLTSMTVVGFETITALDTSANVLGTNSVELSFVPPPPPPVTTSPTTPTTTTHAATHPAAPSANKIKASLASLLSPKGVSIRALLRKGSYAFSYRALAAGKLTIDWWDGPPAKKQKLIGTVTVTVGNAEKLSAKLRLTSTGRSTLRHAEHLKVKSAVSFKTSGKPAVNRSSTFTLH
jgi:adhesin/invasin